MKRRNTSIILSKKDDVSHDESLALMKHLKKDALTGLIIPADLVIERRKICGFCGKPFDNMRTDVYFGEKFHSTCISLMKNGERNA